MSTLASIVYTVPDQYIHIAEDLATRHIICEVSDGNNTVRINLDDRALKKIAERLQRFLD